jgi:hypothetical protein
VSGLSPRSDIHSIGRFPDFLCIGAQKAGTTWLYDNLRSHPQIWLPPVKELHYFNHVHIEEDRTWTPSHRRKASSAALRRHLRNVAPEQGDSVFVERLTEISEGEPDDDWYARIFGVAPVAATCGDITPRYASLPPEGVDHVHRIMPNAKVIYILRDPIDRCWSHVRMLMAEKQTDTPELSIIEKMAQRPGVLERSNYPSTFETWSVYQSEGRFLTLFFDDIAHDPAGLLKSVCEFVGVAYEAGDFRGARKQVHAGPQHTMPPSVNELLKTRLRPVYEDIARRCPARGEAWMALHYGT